MESVVIQGVELRLTPPELASSPAAFRSAIEQLADLPDVFRCGHGHGRA